MILTKKITTEKRQNKTKASPKEENNQCNNSRRKQTQNIKKFKNIFKQIQNDVKVNVIPR